jgi:hypothetical protein
MFMHFLNVMLTTVSYVIMTSTLVATPVCVGPREVHLRVGIVQEVDRPRVPGCIAPSPRPMAGPHTTVEGEVRSAWAVTGSKILSPSVARAGRGPAEIC